MSIAQDARNAGLKPATVYRRKERGTPQEDWYRPVTNLRDVARNAGINYSTLKQRIYALGWDEQKAISEPVALTGIKYYTIGARRYTIEELEEMSGIKREIISHRINSLKWSIQRAISVPVRKRRNRLAMM